jgi:phosphate transport system substrate-binding protein
MTAAYRELVQMRRQQPEEAYAPARAPGRSHFTRPQRLVFVLAVVIFLAIPTTAIARVYLGQGAPSCVSGTLTIDGSTVLHPLVQAVARTYTKQCSNALITVDGGASKTGLIEVEQGHGVVSGIVPGQDAAHIARPDVPVEIGDSDIFASLVQQGDLVDHQVAIVVFGLILNEDVTGVQNLSTAQIRAIYTGVYQNWRQSCDQQCCGPDRPIVPIGRTTNSGTRFAFERYVLDGMATVPGIGLESVLSSGDAVQEVEDNPGSIGYALLSLTNQTHKITIVNVDNHDPHTFSLVQHNHYKFWNVEHM